MMIFLKAVLAIAVGWAAYYLATKVLVLIAGFALGLIVGENVDSKLMNICGFIISIIAIVVYYFCTSYLLNRFAIPHAGFILAVSVIGALISTIVTYVKIFSSNK